jgi:acyl-CoA synthetase (AMP-forming)/AMP-acid ligase II
MGSLAPDNQLAESLGERLDVDYGLWDLLSKSLAELPDADAVVSLWQQDIANNNIKNYPLRWSYAALNEKSDHLANWLLQRGCEKGMHLAVFLWNSAEWVLFFWAAAKLRMSFIPLDPRALASDGNRLLGLTEPTVVAVQDCEAVRLLQKSASPALGSVEILISCDDKPLETWNSLPGILASSQDVLGQQSENPAPWKYSSGQPPNTENFIGSAKALREDESRYGRGDDIAVIIFNSGTTSNSKGCPYTAACCWSASNRFDPNPNPDLRDRWLVHTPVSHIFSINHCLRAFAQGDTVIFASKSFDVKATLRALVEAECTRMSAVPTMVKALLSDPTFPGVEKLKLRYVAMGSTMILEEDIRQAKEGFGSEAVIQSYGMSEGAPITSWRRTDPLLKSGYHPGVGKVLPGANLRICEPGSTNALACGEVGEIHIGGTSVIPHYLHNFESRSFYKDNIGHWLVTGDQGKMDNNGVLHVLGRYKDLIIRGGENIAPLQIESVLNQIPNVTVSIPTYVSRLF